MLDKYFDRGLCCVGKIESGTISIGDKLMINPGKIAVEVSLMEVDEKAVKFGGVDDNIELDVKGASEEVVYSGYVISPRNNLFHCCTKFEGLLMVLDIPTLFSAGYEGITIGVGKVIKLLDDQKIVYKELDILGLVIFILSEFIVEFGLLHLYHSFFIFI